MKFDYKKSLGQNFLKDKNIIKKIVDCIDAKNNDLIVEIGPGAGALTSEIVKKELNLICFEIDKRLDSILEKYKNEKTTIIYDDFLKVDLKKYNFGNYDRLFFVGNLPYYITTAIINKIINESDPYCIIIMIQKEVAQRYMAKPCSKEYNSLSVFLQYHFEIKKVCEVSKNSFEPVPKVDSTVIKLLSRDNKLFLKDEEFFYKFVQDAFKQKRKNLRNNLKNYDLVKIEHELKKFNKSLNNRAEEISVIEFVNICNEIVSH